MSLKNRNPNWKANGLYLGTKLSGYSIVQDSKYPSMYRVRFLNGTLSDMLNLTRAKDAALARLDQDLRAAEKGGKGSQAA